MCCFLACAKAENVSENWGPSNPTLLNLMDLVISRKNLWSRCSQQQQSAQGNRAGVIVWPSFPVCSHGRLGNESRCRNWLSYRKPESFDTREEKERLGCFPMMLLLWSTSNCFTFIWNLPTVRWAPVGMLSQLWFPALRSSCTFEPGRLSAHEV